MKMIALLDCNNFFVSCERLFRPDLNKVPVVVLSGNDGCVVARSKEIKDMGIPMGVPYFKIKDTLENIGAVKFSTNFELYRDISKRVFNEVRKIVGSIEQYSIDECFFEVDSLLAKDICLSVKNAVESAIGIPVSIGVAPSKTIAKYQNKIAKKTNGLSLFDEVVWGSEIHKIKISEMWGVGFAKAKKFTEKNIITVFDFIKLERMVVSNLFGIDGVRLYQELKGESVLSIKTVAALPKSIISSRSFAKETNDFNLIADAVKFHLYQIVASLNDSELLANNVIVTISPNRFGDFFMQSATQELILETGTSDIFKLQEACMDMLKKAYKKGVPYKKAGVAVTRLHSEKAFTQSLFFEGVKVEKDTKNVSDLVLKLNKKLGKDKLLLGRLSTGVNDWQGKKDFLSPTYTTKWSDLKTVKSA